MTTRLTEAARRSSEVPLRIAIGRAVIGALFLLIPLYNPSVLQAGDERLYVGTLLVLVLAALMLPSLASGRFDWILVGLLLAAIYVLEAGVLRGDLRLSVVGNAYRPLHAVLTFCALAVFLVGTNRDRWIRFFLWGGFLGCTFAVVNTVVPAIDPFVLSRPDLGIESKFLESQRQSGGFVYPGNFGPYGAYVALVAFVTLEQKRIRLFSLNLYSAAFVAGLLGIVVSGSRGAALGLLLGGAVVLWRAPVYSLLVGATVAALGLIVSLALLLAGTLEEIVESRFLLVGFSFERRLESWEFAIEAFRESPLFGSGVVPNTIDSTLFYLLHVGGLVGLALAVAMYWVTVLRPIRFRDWSGLPIVVAILGIGITQDSLGSPLSSWAIAAGVFLLISPHRETAILVTGESRPLVPPERRRAAIAVGGLILAFGVGIGVLLAGRLPTEERVAPVPELDVDRTILLPALPSVDGMAGPLAAVTDAARSAENEPLWIVASGRDEFAATQYRLDDVVADVARAVASFDTSRPRSDRALAGDVSFDVATWGDEAVFAVFAVRGKHVEVQLLDTEGRAGIASGTARLPALSSTMRRHVRLAVWSGLLPDLFVVDHGPAGDTFRVHVYSGESGFRERILLATARGPGVQDAEWTVDIARITGDMPDLVLVTPRGASQKPEVHIASGESRFAEYLLRIPIDLDAERAQSLAFATGSAAGSPVLYGASTEEATLDVIPLRHLP